MRYSSFAEARETRGHGTGRSVDEREKKSKATVVGYEIGSDDLKGDVRDSSEHNVCK